jgi:hypothetical protein
MHIEASYYNPLLTHAKYTEILFVWLFNHGKIIGYAYMLCPKGGDASVKK